MNTISYEDQLLNLCALLAEQDPEQASAVEGDRETINEIEVGQYYVTLFVEDNLNTWYISSCEGKNSDNMYDMYQLIRCQSGSNLQWKQPQKVDKANLLPGSIISCIVDGEWDVLKDRNMNFTLRNHCYISDLVGKISDKCV